MFILLACHALSPTNPSVKEEDSTVGQTEIPSPDSGSTSGSSDSTQDSSATTLDSAPESGPPAVAPPCNWANLRRPHWSVALPWLLADPALSTGIPLDEGRPPKTAVGTIDGEGNFDLVIIAGAESAFSTFSWAGNFDAETGVGAWTLTWETQDGSSTSREVVAAWDGCDLVERFDASPPWLGSSVSVARRTWFEGDGTAHGWGATRDTVYDPCYSDEEMDWTSIVAPDGDVLAVGRSQYNNGYEMDTISWTVLNTVERPHVQLTDDRYYYICCCSVGTGGDAYATLSLSADGDTMTWAAEQSWSLYDRDVSAWTDDGAATLDGNMSWGLPASLYIAYNERYVRFPYSGADETEDVAACDGVWEPATGASWSCPVSISPNAGFMDWIAPPSIALWAP